MVNGGRRRDGYNGVCIRVRGGGSSNGRDDVEKVATHTKEDDDWISASVSHLR